MKARSMAVAALAAGVVLAVGGCGGGSTSGGSTTEPVAAQQPAAPAGSGHGLCFDVNSDLAKQAMARLSPPPGGKWQVGQASDDQLSAGCDGVLSWMEVASTLNHPYTHMLFFTNGTYLGTATSDPYMYTKITGHTRTSLTLTYHWIKGDEPMCCPQGGPSVVTFTLNGTKVTADGQFPPHS
ncbi:LppP/LprE family lipoprotein [Nocardia sp. CDC160]|uniref:LppP/LprE family lipoprotein n=1 Tax=Nocardia sp. CDC160 TaxID=3112166 RepID=UPI002DB89214|nr:LppP/LprE family lipoprotein [Nocardia sp. CDC160]MEC3915643.1 LppP/LprE family lipoprotein [Nocardia sp. CDC160]